VRINAKEEFNLRDMTSVNTSQNREHAQKILQPKVGELSKRFQDCLTKFQGMSSSMRVDGMAVKRGAILDHRNAA